MVRIENQSDLRVELSGLLDAGMVQSGGPLERRGVEVDHNLYLPKENRRLDQSADAVPAESSSPSSSSASPPVVAAPPSVTTQHQSAPAEAAASAPARETQQLRDEIQDLRSEIETLHERLERTESTLDEIRRDLGM